MKIDSLFISDVHLGSRGSNSNELIEVLKKYEPENIFIIGDFIDGWLLRRRWYWNKNFTLLIRKLILLSVKGVNIVYITGNHDEFLREFTPFRFNENIVIVDEYIWDQYYISHGDLYDGVVKLKWLGKLGGIGYELAILIDRLLKKIGFKRSFSKWVKTTVKDAVKFVTNFENQLSFQAKQRNCVGVICGHIHTPVIKDVIIGDKVIQYINCGDWIENNSYIVYNDGKFKIEYFT
jgi:UDP-2,3-diacylglucosamine pyrophosphatase LpxH